MGLFSPYPVVLVLYPTIREKTKSTDTKKRPKAFYQFWASNVVILALTVDTLVNNNLDDIMLVTIIIIITSSLSSATKIYSIYNCYMMLRGGRNTCAQYNIMSCILYTASLVLYSTAISLFIVVTPALIFIFYLYPTHTLIRLPFIINSILYTNSLLALLLYQCERLVCCRCYDVTIASDEEKARTDCKHICQPIITICILPALVSFILVINDLFKLQQNHFTDKSEVETLILLVPTLLLLFGSWYRLDVFFDIEKKKSKEELLSEILEEMKRQRTLAIESPVNAPPVGEQTMNESHQITENRGNTNDTDANTADTRVEITRTDENTPLVPPNPPASYSSANN